MDAPEAEADIKLQRVSSELIADLDSALGRFRGKPDSRGKTRARSWVRARETLQATMTLLDMFQELPQLLDPRFATWIPALANSFLEYCLVRHGVRRAPRRARSTDLLVPLDQAICRVLYTLCKVRGEKVVVRFLNAEARYLELLLAALEDTDERGRHHDDNGDDGDNGNGNGWTWEQRYVVLLWLSHLLLAPFDLATISSVELDGSVGLPPIAGFRWPDGLPALAVRLLRLAIRLLGSPGKEQDAAKALLVRLAMRRDMQQLGLVDSLVGWLLASLRLRQGAPMETTFFYLGVLSLLAGLLRSAAKTSDLHRYLPSIFQAVYDVALGQSELSKALMPLASVRKMMLKVLRSVVVSLLRSPCQDMASTELVETAIGYLLDSLSDTDTPVRQSASKALSVVTLKLDAEMATQVVEAVLAALNRNVLWSPSPGAARNLSAVNPVEWHGLMLTLAHLLYRRSPPAAQLPDILHALLLGLSFEQRSTSGSSVGTNVRDAACFGVWATARRYTSQELLAVPTGRSAFAAKGIAAPRSMLHVLATELVVAACLDPAGNIRRGASAALQELIGRHPDTVEQGIAVVQTVDYHAVARRSRASAEVASGVARLSPLYAEALSEGILGWRGVRDTDAHSRRVAGSALGVLAAKLSKAGPADAMSCFGASIQRLTERLEALASWQVEERHGLLLCFASVVDELFRSFGKVNEKDDVLPSRRAGLMQTILTRATHVLDDCCSTTDRKPELVAEGASRLVVSLLPVVQAVLLPDLSHTCLETGEQALSPPLRTGPLAALVAAVDSEPAAMPTVDVIVSRLRAVMPAWLSRNEVETVEATSKAALFLVVFSKPEEREKTVAEWCQTVRRKPSSRASTTGGGYFQGLALVQPLAELKRQGQGGTDIVCEAFVERWKADSTVETRVVLLGSLMRSQALVVKPAAFLDLLAEGLDDYKTTARGDEGSHVRVEALRAVRALWQRLRDRRTGELPWAQASVTKLSHSVLRLAAEKLDRVRPEAQEAVSLLLQESHASRFQTLDCSSAAYFEILLQLASSEWWHGWLPQPGKANAEGCMAELLAGLVTSADTGNDDLVMASREALTRFCEASPAQARLVSGGLLRNLKRWRTGSDRVTVPTLEVTAFLSHCGLMQRWEQARLGELCRETQRAGYKTGNVRKLLACVRVYGGLATCSPWQTRTDARHEDQGGFGHEERGVDAARGVAAEARRRLGALLFHPWPRVRSAVVDEVWALLCQEPAREGLLGTDWAEADKETIRETVRNLRLE